MDTVLFFTNISPFPTNGGERIRSYYLLKTLAGMGYRVIALIRNTERVDLEEYQMENVIFYTHDKIALPAAATLTGRQYFKRWKHVLDLFEQVCSRYGVSAAFLDYGYVGHYIRFFMERKIPVILGTHNAQALHTWQAPAKGVLGKIRKAQLVALEKLHERRYFNKASAVLVVSEQDRRYHEQFVATEKLFTVPNFLDEKDYEMVCPRKPEVLVMTANFGQYMNYHGLKWFIEEVWDDDLASRYGLWLVGKQSKEALQQLTGRQEWKNISAFGKVDDVKWYISVACGVVIPLLHGSGTRLKCLEAMALGTPVISTSKGVEGVRSEHFLIADTPADFKNTLLAFNGDSNRGALLKADFMKEYSAAVNKERLGRAIGYAMN
jgi:glycosyltransferase involved in cell wall biosynthesis